MDALGATSLASELVAVCAEGLPAGSPLLPPCEHLLESEGKHLRPRLVSAAAATGSLPYSEQVRSVILAVELFHCASLAHDDVLDDAPARRGRKTVGNEFGVTTAALMGGWLFGRGAIIAARGGEKAMCRYSEAASVICDGQMLEICDLFDVGRSRDRYMNAIGGKTATLFELCAALGAEVSRAEPAVVDTVSESAWNMGLAFQILDDVMDLLAPASAGKLVGKDLLQGVYTLPVIYAVREAPQLKRYLAPGATPASLPSILEAICATDGPTRALEDAAGHAGSARDTALALPGGEDIVEFIDDVLMKPMERLS